MTKWPTQKQKQSVQHDTGQIYYADANLIIGSDNGTLQMQQN